MGGNGGEEVLAERERKIGRKEGEVHQKQSNKGITQTNRKRTHTISRGMEMERGMGREIGSSNSNN